MNEYRQKLSKALKKHQDKEYNPCEVCTFDLVTDKHHPDGAEKVFVALPPRSMPGAEVEHIYNDELHRLPELEAADYEIRIERMHRNPDNYVYLCPNCHAIHHRTGTSIRTLKKLHESTNWYKRQFKLERYIIEMEERLLAETRGGL